MVSCSPRSMRSTFLVLFFSMTLRSCSSRDAPMRPPAITPAALPIRAPLPPPPIAPTPAPNTPPPIIPVPVFIVHALNTTKAKYLIAPSYNSSYRVKFFLSRGKGMRERKKRRKIDLGHATLSQPDRLFFIYAYFFKRLKRRLRGNGSRRHGPSLSSRRSGRAFCVMMLCERLCCDPL